MFIAKPPVRSPKPSTVSVPSSTINSRCCVPSSKPTAYVAPSNPDGTSNATARPSSLIAIDPVADSETALPKPCSATAPTAFIANPVVRSPVALSAREMTKPSAPSAKVAPACAPPIVPFTSCAPINRYSGDSGVARVSPATTVVKSPPDKVPAPTT